MTAAPVMPQSRPASVAPAVPGADGGYCIVNAHCVTSAKD